MAAAAAANGRLSRRVNRRFSWLRQSETVKQNRPNLENLWCVCVAFIIRLVKTADAP